MLLIMRFQAAGAADVVVMGVKPAFAAAVVGDGGQAGLCC